MNSARRNKLLWLALLLLFLAAGVLVFLSWNNKRQAEATRDQAQQRYQELVRQQGDSENSAAAYREALSAWQNWQGQGLLRERGEAQWQQELRQGQQRLRLPGLVAERLPPRETEKLSGPRWQAVPMRLQLQLLHEEDLLRFIAWLQQPEQPPSQLRRCSLAPADATNANSLLLADCELHWQRIQLDKGKT